jgi:hypothetical protein
MAFKENMKHPNFIIGAMSFFLLLSGVVLKGNGFRAGVYMIIVSVVLGFIHWVWGITDVAKNQQLNSKSRPFWIVVVLIIPPIGGMFYYLMKTKNVLM